MLGEPEASDDNPYEFMTNVRLVFLVPDAKHITVLYDIDYRGFPPDEHQVRLFEVLVSEVWPFNDSSAGMREISNDPLQVLKNRLRGNNKRPVSFVASQLLTRSSIRGPVPRDFLHVVL